MSESLDNRLEVRDRCPDASRDALAGPRGIRLGIVAYIGRAIFQPSRTSLAIVVLVLLSGITNGQERFGAKVVGVTDGDTLSVMREGRAITVRLDGIDCPENGQDFSARAKQFTSAKAFGKVATVQPRDTDRYGRTVARVYVGGGDLSLSLVRAGFAWHFKRYSSDATLAKAEIAARAASVGVWSHPNAIPPWEFRRPIRVEAASFAGLSTATGAAECFIGRAVGTTNAPTARWCSRLSTKRLRRGSGPWGIVCGRHT